MQPSNKQVQSCPFFVRRLRSQGHPAKKRWGWHGEQTRDDTNPGIQPNCPINIGLRWKNLLKTGPTQGLHNLRMSVKKIMDMLNLLERNFHGNVQNLKCLKQHSLTLCVQSIVLLHLAMHFWCCQIWCFIKTVYPVLLIFITTHPLTYQTQEFWVGTFSRNKGCAAKPLFNIFQLDKYQGLLTTQSMKTHLDASSGAAWLPASVLVHGKGWMANLFPKR